MNVELPDAVKALIDARNALQFRYSDLGLSFTLDGNLVGDIGEAVAAELFDLSLVSRSKEGIDAVANDGRTVQIKATGTNRGPVFRNTSVHADHLLFFSFNFEELTGKLIYNGPEYKVRALLPLSWEGQRMVPMSKVKTLVSTLNVTEMLKPR